MLDIWKQFLLLLSDTKKIALDSGIKHLSIRGGAQVMSTDFLVDSNDKQFAIQIKPVTALQDERTLEKLELECRYWQQMIRHRTSTQRCRLSAGTSWT